jgi:hypothetical protein
MNGAVMLSGAKHLWLFLGIAKQSEILRCAQNDIH